MAARSRKRQVKPELVVIPAQIRSSFEHLSFCFDVKLTQTQRRELLETCDAQTDEDYFVRSSKGDLEVALHVRSVSKRPSRLHVTIQYRRGAVSPFPRVPKVAMRQALDVLNSGAGLDLVHVVSEIFVEVPKDKQLKLPVVEFPPLGRLRMSAIEYATENDGDEPVTTIRLVERGLKICTTAAIERRVKSLEHGMLQGVKIAAHAGELPGEVK